MAETYTDPMAGVEEGQTEGISPWAKGYVTSMLNWAQSNLPGASYPSYTGDLYAPTSPLQSLAFTGYQNLTAPNFAGIQGSMGQIGRDIYNARSYTPTYSYTPGDFYTAPTGGYTPGTFGGYYTAPEGYTPATVTSPFDRSRIDAYTASDISSARFPEFYEEYMSPYIEGVVQPQIREARRQSDISGEQQASRMARAGSFGGARQAIMEAERERNLQQQVGDITGQGYQRAYEQGLQAFTSDEARRLQARQMSEQSKQFASQMGVNIENMAAQYGLEADKMNELANQFAYGQKMTAAELQARYGLEADTAQELANQFDYSQQMAASELAARYNLEGTQLGESAAQFASQYGLNALKQALSAYQSQANLMRMGYELNADQQANLLTAGGIQRGIEADRVAEQLRQYELQTGWPLKTIALYSSLLNGLPMQQVQRDLIEPSGWTEVLGGAGGLLSILSTIKGAGGLEDLLKDIF